MFLICSTGWMNQYAGGELNWEGMTCDVGDIRKFLCHSRIHALDKLLLCVGWCKNMKPKHCTPTQLQQQT